MSQAGLKCAKSLVKCVELSLNFVKLGFICVKSGLNCVELNVSNWSQIVTGT